MKNKFIFLLLILFLFGCGKDGSQGNSNTVSLKPLLSEWIEIEGKYRLILETNSSTVKVGNIQVVSLTIKHVTRIDGFCWGSITLEGVESEGNASISKIQNTKSATVAFCDGFIGSYRYYRVFDSLLKICRVEDKFNCIVLK